jgi:hypothetical protein
VWIGNEPAHDRDALDQFGDALNQQEREPDDDQRFGGPLRQAAGIAGLLVDFNRAHEERAAGDDHDDAKRQQEKDVANDVDDVAPALGKQVVHDVDTDVFVVEQRPGRAKQEDDAEQHPLQFQPGVRGDVEALPDDRVNG